MSLKTFFYSVLIIIIIAAITIFSYYSDINSPANSAGIKFANDDQRNCCAADGGKNN